MVAAFFCISLRIHRNPLTIGQQFGLVVLPHSVLTFNTFKARRFRVVVFKFNLPAQLNGLHVIALHTRHMVLPLITGQVSALRSCWIQQYSVWIPSESYGYGKTSPSV